MLYVFNSLTFQCHIMRSVFFFTYNMFDFIQQSDYYFCYFVNDIHRVSKVSSKPYYIVLKLNSIIILSNFTIIITFIYR